jgi:hypothetical protein
VQLENLLFLTKYRLGRFSYGAGIGHKFHYKGDHTPLFLKSARAMPNRRFAAKLSLHRMTVFFLPEAEEDLI